MRMLFKWSTGCIYTSLIIGRPCVAAVVIEEHVCEKRKGAAEGI